MSTFVKNSLLSQDCDLMMIEAFSCVPILCQSELKFSFVDFKLCEKPAAKTQDAVN